MPDSNSNSDKSLTHHNQIKVLTIWFLTLHFDHFALCGLRILANLFVQQEKAYFTTTQTKHQLSLKFFIFFRLVEKYLKIIHPPPI
jgi:hypothetical protein